MVEVYNKIKKIIDLLVGDKYLKWLNQGTLGCVNHTNLALLQYLFNTFFEEKLGYIERNDERTR